MLKRLRPNLRSKLLIAHLLVIGMGVVTLFLAITLIAPPLFDQLMIDVTGPQMRRLGHVMTPQAEDAMRELTAAAFRQAITVSLIWATTAAVVTAVVVSVFVAVRISGPILRMALASKRIAAGRYAERVPEGGSDELGQLATSFNEMAGTLETVERQRRELIGDVAHELRTPIANLQGYLEGLMDGVVQPSQETWSFLLGETGRLRRLVNDLQELSRAEARQISMDAKPASPEKLVDLAVGRLGPEFAERELVLKASASPKLPRVMADEDRAIQVLTNLLSNALRYTSSGGRVEVCAEPLEDAVVFRVKDTGIGVAPEHLPHLFDRFYRADRARTRAAGGSGIGLTIARALVEAMGGHIWAESPGPGLGSTFSFTLPQAH